jgi:phosphoribosylglycinamide formyltransferase-1
LDRRARLAILLSGRGSNFAAIADAVDAGRIPDAEIVAVVSDNVGAPGLEFARERGLPVFSLASSKRTELERELRKVLAGCRPDLICLAGFMRILSPELVAEYRGRILNIHPSLLPKFRGLHPQRRALEAGETESGCTVHYVDEGVDSGESLLQRRVPILPGDTEESLSARILEKEHEAYPEAVRIALSRLK